MLCKQCGKNNAEIYCKQTINGHTEEYALCHECAEKLKKEGKLNIGFTSPSLFGGIGGYGSLFGFDDFFGLPTVKKGGHLSAQKKCTLCSSTFEDLVKSGKVGCAECYRVFREELTPSIEKIHGKGGYTGKKPAKIKIKDTKQEEIKGLKSQLKAAVKAQEYEKAAVIRDKIRELENGGQEE